MPCSTHTTLYKAVVWQIWRSMSTHPSFLFASDSRSVVVQEPVKASKQLSVLCLVINQLFQNTRRFSFFVFSVLYKYLWGQVKYCAYSGWICCHDRRLVLKPIRADIRKRMLSSFFFFLFIQKKKKSISCTWSRLAWSLWRNVTVNQRDLGKQET